MKKTLIVWGIAGFLLSFALGFFAGREHLRSEIKDSYQEMVERVSDRYLEHKEQQLEKAKQEYQENYDKAMEEYEQALAEQEESGEIRFGVTPPVAMPAE